MSEFKLTEPFDEQLLPGSFDTVMAFHVSAFFEDTDVILNRIAELLSPGGLFISDKPVVSATAVKCSAAHSKWQVFSDCCRK